MTDLFDYAVELAREAGERAMQQVGQNAGDRFRDEAKAFRDLLTQLSPEEPAQLGTNKHELV